MDEFLLQPREFGSLVNMYFMYCCAAELDYTTNRKFEFCVVTDGKKRYSWLLVAWTWTRNPTFVQSLSSLCPTSVHVHSTSNLCPCQVQTLSSLNRFSLRMDRDWTSTSRVSPVTVNKTKKCEKILTGQTLDRGWTCNNCGQGSHFGFSEKARLG